MYAGRGAKLQVGVQSNFSTIVAQTKAISITKEGMKYVPTYKARDALVAQRGPGSMDILGVKVEGDFSCLCYPDEIGVLISAIMGSEASPAAVSGSAVYDHVFTPMSALAGSSLPKLTITVDRVAAVYGYVGCKLDTMSLEIKKLDYLRATFTVRGYNEETDTIDALSLSTKKPFSFAMGSATLGGAAYDIEEATLKFDNKLEDELFTLYSSGVYMREIEAQGAELTGDVTVLYDTTSHATRSTVFKGGTTTSLVFTFVSTDEVLTGKYYTLTISIPVVYITDASPTVDGPDRLKQKFSIQAAGNPICTITLGVGQSTKNIT
jgi:hypothetical protein